MLNIYTSNNIQSLVQHLSLSIDGNPLESPFTPEIIAVNSTAMEKWLRIRISEISGVEANYQFPLPASLLWSVLQRQFNNLPETDPLSRSHLQWHIFTRLPTLLDQPDFSVLKKYIKNDTNGIKRWQLSVKIADVFDRYQYYRPDWLTLAIDENHWQKLLWEEIIAKVNQHKTQIVDDFIAACQAGQIQTANIPERISLFAPSTLPSLLLNTLLQLAHITEINFYLLAPTDQYWLDLVSQKAAAITRLRRPDETAYLDTGNRLLSSWGTQGQIFFDQLISSSEQAKEYQYFQEPLTTSVLDQLKHDIYTLQDANVEQEKILKEQDNSLIIHCCHSPLREVQVLHDQLLDLFVADDTLDPEDILVVAPDISQYASYIEAVFQKNDNKPFIPWNLSDTDLDTDIPIIRIFLQLLSLPDSRFEHSEVLSYLDIPEIRQKFKLDDDDIVLIYDWLEASAVRWGKSGQHKHALGLPEITQNTWMQAKNRLFMGYALGETDKLFEDIAPISQVEGNASEALGKFWQLYDTLETYSQYLKKAQPLADWQATIKQLLDDLFDDSQSDEGHLQTIRDSINDLVNETRTYGTSETISRQLLQLMLQDKLAETSNLHAFMSGGVSFSGFKPMRNLPFKVIVILGMNDTSFPRQTHRIEFDLMHKHYQAGDPNARNEDRYLFLETLLSAENTLLISYIGRSLKDNSEKQPSVLLRELMDYLDLRFTASANDTTPYSQHICHTHRLQAYHSSYFKTPDSYDRYWCKVAQQINNPPENKTISWEDVLLEEPDATWRDIDVNRLISFFRHPIRAFFQQRLKIYLGDHSERCDDDEPFDFDALEQYKLKARLLDEWLQHRCIKTTQAELHAEGLLPHGQVADEIMQSMDENIEPLFQQIETIVGDERAKPLAINLTLCDDSHCDWKITGSLSHVYPNIGLVEIKPSKLKGVDQLEFWIKYMLYRLSNEDGYCQDGHIIDIENSYTIAAHHITQDDAKAYLQDLLKYYWLGMCKPLALLPKSSAEMIKQERNGKSFQGENSTAWKADGAFNSPTGDLYDPYIELALREMAELPINTQEFIDVSHTAYRFEIKK